MKYQYLRYLMFNFQVAVSYHDLEPLGEEKLHGSKLVVKAEAVLESGSRQVVYDIEVREAS